VVITIFELIGYFLIGFVASIVVGVLFGFCGKKL